MSKIGGGNVLHPMPQRSGRIVLAALLALAWVQLAYAGHQFEHTAGDRTDTCSVCSHFERLDHAVPMELPSSTAAVDRALVEEPSAFPSRSALPRHYQSRAPPTVS